MNSPYRKAAQQNPPDPPPPPKRINWDYAWRAAVMVSIVLYFAIVPLTAGLLYGGDAFGWAIIGVPGLVVITIALVLLFKFTWQEWVRTNGSLFDDPK